MKATLNTLLTFTEDDFSDSQVVRIKRQIRALATAMSAIEEGAPEAPALLIAKLAVHMTTGVNAVSIAPQFFDSLVSYAETSLAVYGEGGES